MSKIPKNQNVNTIIYTLADPDSLAIRYVGKTIKSLNYRLSDHIYSPKRESNYRTNWITSLLKKGKKPLIEIIEECKWKDSQELEMYWISQFKTWGFKLVNLTIGGEGNLGRTLSKETKLQISISNSKKVYQYDLDGNFIKEWESCTIAGKYLKKNNSKICACARGDRNAAYGYMWTYKKVNVLPKYDRGKTLRGKKLTKTRRDKAIKNLKGYGKNFR
jgi:hypothetical protein